MNSQLHALSMWELLWLDNITELPQEELDKLEFNAKFYLKHKRYPTKREKKI